MKTPKQRFNSLLDTLAERQGTPKRAAMEYLADKTGKSFETVRQWAYRESGPNAIDAWTVECLELKLQAGLL